MREMVCRTCALSAVVILAGCSPSVPRVIERPVVVEKTVQVAIPEDFLIGCAGRPPPLSTAPTPSDEADQTLPTNGDLLMSWNGWKSYATCLESKLQSIRDVQPLPE